MMIVLFPHLNKKKYKKERKAMYILFFFGRM